MQADSIQLRESIIFKSPLITIGSFICPPDYECFSDTGPTKGFLLVFPSEAVSICHEGKRPVQADPNCVMIYNQGQKYTRRVISKLGDISLWIRYQPSLLQDLLGHFPACISGSESRLFAIDWSPVTTPSYFQHCQLIQQLSELNSDQNRAKDCQSPVKIESLCIGLLESVLQTACKYWLGKQSACRSTTHGKHRDLVLAIQEVLVSGYQQKLGLNYLSDYAGVSPYHLLRIFKQETGFSLHQYQIHLRLRQAAQLLTDQVSLTRISMDLGFDSPSHFSSQFSHHFGMSPSGFRRLLPTSKFLKV